MRSWRYSNATSLFRDMSAGWIFFFFLTLIGLISAGNLFSLQMFLLLKNRGTVTGEIKEKLNVSPYNNAQSLLGDCVAFASLSWHVSPSSDGKSCINHCPFRKAEAIWGILHIQKGTQKVIWGIKIFCSTGKTAVKNVRRLLSGNKDVWGSQQSHH